MIVVKQFSAELKIQFSAELFNAFLDFLRLQTEIFFVVKTSAEELMRLPIQYIIQAQPLQ